MVKDTLAAIDAKEYKCHCCKKDFRPNGLLGGRKPCGCESAICFKCNKCNDHCTCEWGKGAKLRAIITAVKRKHIVIAPLRKRVESLLSQNELPDQCRQLLQDALNESETNFTMYQAWVKRATEAEVECDELKAELARVTAERDALRKAVELQECPHCYQPSLERSPINSEEGFCWNCKFVVSVRKCHPFTRQQKEQTNDK